MTGGDVFPEGVWVDVGASASARLRRVEQERDEALAKRDQMAENAEWWRRERDEARARIAAKIAARHQVAPLRRGAFANVIWNQGSHQASCGFPLMIFD